MYLTTLTQKGQVTIPVQIRKMFNLKDKQKIEFDVVDDKIQIRPVNDFLSLAGHFSHKNKGVVNEDSYDKVFKEKFKQKYEKKYKNS